MKVSEYYAKGGANRMGNYFKPTNVAQTIALASEGEEVPSQYAPFKQMKYTLSDGRAWYASLSAAPKVAKIPVGDPFRVCLREFAPGKNVLDVRPVSAPAAPSKLESQLVASLERVSYEPADEDAPPARNGNGNGHAAPPINGNGWSPLRAALVATIEDATIAEAYAATKGMSIRFAAEDIRAMAITCVIGAQKGGR